MFCSLSCVLMLTRAGLVSDWQLFDDQQHSSAAYPLASCYAVQDIFEDVPINDLGPTMRAALIRRSFLANVERQTGSTLMLRGRHYGPGASMLPGQPPLHIHISTSAMHGQVCSITPFQVIRLKSCTSCAIVHLCA
jgi:hypothetical protein